VRLVGSLVRGIEKSLPGLERLFVAALAGQLCSVIEVSDELRRYE
jgi:hypothetical protein